mmetsp:Transcript_53389/g.172457  ORF Transcript_53389/g.172457 Transcript_53389/m.172457 type:complete len:311 (+) Transcript_53389:379-1311(+)
MDVRRNALKEVVGRSAVVRQPLVLWRCAAPARVRPIRRQALQKLRHALAVDGHVVQELAIVGHGEIALEHPKHRDGVESIPISAAWLIGKQVHKQIVVELPTTECRQEKTAHPDWVQQRLQCRINALVPKERSGTSVQLVGTIGGVACAERCQVHSGSDQRKVGALATEHRETRHVVHPFQVAAAAVGAAVLELHSGPAARVPLGARVESVTPARFPISPRGAPQGIERHRDRQSSRGLDCRRPCRGHCDRNSQPPRVAGDRHSARLGGGCHVAAGGRQEGHGAYRGALRVGDGEHSVAILSDIRLQARP